MIEEIESSSRRTALARVHSSHLKKESAQPLRWLCFITMVMLFTIGLASGACNAASTSPEVRVGSELEFQPYAFVDQSGQPAGFSVELIKAVANAIGISIKISTGSWDTMWNSLVAGQLDVLPIVAKLPERQLLIDFSLPHTETYDAFFVRKGDSPIQNIAAARGKEIVVMRSDAAHHELLKRNFQGNLILVDTIPEGLNLILSGKHSAFLCSKLIGTLAIKGHKLSGLTAGPTIPDYKRVFSFGVKKGDRELLEKLNQGLLIVKTNGEYDRIYDKWLSFDDPWRKLQKYLLPAVIMVVTFALIAGFWLVMLRRLVNKRTRELAERNEMLLHSYDNLEARVQERTMDLAQSNQLLQAEIIERKKTEEAQRIQSRTFSEVLNSLDSLVYVNDMNSYEILFINTYGQNIWGDINGKICWQTIQAGQAGPCNFCTNSKIVGPDGNPTEVVAWEFQNTVNKRWFDCRDRAIYWPDGRIVRMEIATDITDRKRVEEVIQKSNEKLIALNKQLLENQHRLSLNEGLFRGLFDNMTSGAAIYTVINDGSKGSDYVIKSFNKTSLNIEGKTLAAVVGRSLVDLRPTIDNYGLIPVLKKVWETGEPASFPAKIYRDEHFSNYYENYVFKIPSGEVVTIYNDVTENKLAEEQIKASLLEKEIMLKEIHHRVKNNLQVISSLLNMQSSYLQDEKAKEMLQNSIDRVSTMAKIHTMLYQSTDLARIDFGGFIRDLVARLQQTYGIAKSPIALHVNVADVSMTIEKSIPCGLILNELVSNALKHAFPEGKHGGINISMTTAGDRFVLTVQDNGIGFPPSIDFHNTRSLGLELVRLLVTQLNGDIDLEVGGGSKFTITFPVAIKKG